jgi:hypothetical protein
MPAATHDLHFVQFSLSHVTGEVRINGIPVWSVPKDLEETDQTIPINAYMVSGTNQVELVLDIEGSPSTCMRPRQVKPRDDQRGTARVLRMGPAGGFPSPSTGTVLGSVEWLGQLEKSEQAPRSVSFAFDAGAGFGTWSWQTAPSLRLDEATVLEAQVLIEQVRASLRSGNAKELLRLIEICFRETGEAFGAKGDAEDIAQLEGWIGQWAAEPERVLPMDPAELDLRLVAADRVIVALNRDWTHAVRLRQAVTDQDDNPCGDFDLPYPLMMARVGKKLAIVR